MTQTKTLPALTGSDKQVAWAETLRAKALNTILTMVDPTASPEAAMGYAVLKHYAGVLIAEETGARFWIDTKDRSVRDWRTKALTIAARKCGYIDDTKDVIPQLAAMTPDRVKMIGEWALRETSMVEVVSAEEATA